MEGIERKAAVMYENLCNTYRAGGEKEETCKEVFGNDFVEDMTAALLAQYILYCRVTESSPDDLIGFTHLLNRAAVQYCMEKGQGQD